ncbi:hypothetical protein L195_g045024 [Trifolium pratense]|uniref:RNase H type-1 domain-containing protein n=1 Tax=Trifolium pratense TaxID=57577 RepID=A0A2K3MDP8_TRIPR|nr:hypothetical protein L195_g045024 [Trifolium pratense]
MTAKEDVICQRSEAEAWSLHQGLQWVANMGYRKVVFEMDCKVVVDDVNKCVKQTAALMLLHEQLYLMLLATLLM